MVTFKINTRYMYWFIALLLMFLVCFFVFFASCAVGYLSNNDNMAKEVCFGPVSVSSAWWVRWSWCFALVRRFDRNCRILFGWVVFSLVASCFFFNFCFCNLFLLSPFFCFCLTSNFCYWWLCSFIFFPFWIS